MRFTLKQGHILFVRHEDDGSGLDRLNVLKLYPLMSVLDFLLMAEKFKLSVLETSNC